MSPFEILGVRPMASIEEAEAAYRARLREWHPDLHVRGGPDAVARAEQRTRELNEAIRAIRAGRCDVEQPVSHCGLCGVPLDTARDHRVHLIDHAHAALRARARRRPPRLSWMPAPMFWSLVVVTFYWAIVFSVFGDSATAVAGWWIGVVSYLLFLPVAYRADRYRRRF